MTASPILLIRRGDETRHAVLLDGAAVLGSAPENHVVLAGAEVSRRHARILRINGSLRVADLGSQTGTRLNGAALPSRSPIPIEEGDEIQIGAYTLTLKPGTRANQAATVMERLGAAGAATVAGRPPSPPDTNQTVLLHGWSQANAILSRDTPLVEAVSFDLRGRERVLVGRLPANDLVLDYPAVSRFHARITRGTDADESPYLIEDLDSANGTFVNGERLSVEAPHPLASGDTIRIGAVRLVLRRDSLEQIDESRDVRLDARGLNQPVRKGVNLLQGISLSVLPRELVAVVGVSGAGKSTLLNALAGFNPAREGTVLVNGEDFYQSYDAWRGNLGYVPQEDIIHGELTVGHALDYAARLRLPADTSREERQRRVEEVLAALGLSERRDVLVRDLSGGQRKRVSIGVELLTKPALFFLDEATSGLDPGTELQMMRLLRGLADDGHTILLVTHATKNVALCDQVLFLARGGYLAWYGPPAEALRYFGVEDFDAIYEKLEGELTPAEWARRYRQSPAHQRYVAARLAGSAALSATPGSAAPRTGVDTPPRSGRPARPRGSMLRQARVLTARYLEIIRRDRAGLLLAFLVPILLGAIDLLAWPRDILHPVTGTADRTMTMLFLATIMPFLVGGLGSAREIVKESAIYRRERMVSLRIAPYLLSKAGVALIFSLYSAAVFLAFKLAAVDLGALGADRIGALYVTLALACLAGALWGLLISALARREEQVMMLVVLVVVLQIVFSGGILPLKNLGPAGQVLGSVTSSKWVFQAEVAALEVKRGDCDGAGLQNCRLPGIERLESNAERRVMMTQVDERFRAVFGQRLATSWAALLAIITGLFVLLVLLQRRKDVA